MPEHFNHSKVIKLGYTFDQTSGMWRLVHQEIDPGMVPILTQANALPLIALVKNYHTHTVPITNALFAAKLDGGSADETLQHETSYEICWEILKRPGPHSR